MADHWWRALASLGDALLLEQFLHFARVAPGARREREEYPTWSAGIAGGRNRGLPRFHVRGCDEETESEVPSLP